MPPKKKGGKKKKKKSGGNAGAAEEGASAAPSAEQLASDVADLSLTTSTAAAPPAAPAIKVEYTNYSKESEMLDIVAMIEKDLSEPYSIFTYRYFIHNWPDLCFLAFADGRMIGNIVCKADRNKGAYRGYIAMLAVEKSYRKHGIGELCTD